MTLQKKSDTQIKVASLLPRFETDDEEKRRFLSFRICGFSELESLRYSDIKPYELVKWKSTDSIFETINYEELPAYQDKGIDAVLDEERTKNYRRTLAIDADVLDDAATNGVEGLSDKQFEHLKGIKNKYDQRVVTMLGLEPGDQMPSTMDELTLRFRRYSNAESIEESDNDNEQAETFPSGQEHIIEAEYKESTNK